MTDRRVRGKIAVRRIFVGFVGDDDDAARAFGRDLMRDLPDRQPALGGLPTGHRDGIVIEDLVSDVDACRGGGADGQQAGMGVGAVAEVLEHMRLAK